MPSESSAKISSELMTFPVLVSLYSYTALLVAVIFASRQDDASIVYVLVDILIRVTDRIHLIYEIFFLGFR